MSRRMFSDEVVSHDNFLSMSHVAQCLYVQLGVRADDDGFVSNAKSITRLTGGQPEHLQELIDNKFIIMFDDGIVCIKHWRINNFIRKDRYKPTNFTEKKDMLYVKENMAYTLNKLKGKPIAEVPWKSDKERRSTSGQPTVAPSKEKISKEKVINKGEKKVALELPDWLDKQKWGEWLEYRKSRRLTTSNITLGRQIQFLGRFQSQHREIIEQSITNGWQGLFEPKNGMSKTPSNVLKTDNRSKLVQAMKDKAKKNG